MIPFRFQQKNGSSSIAARALGTAAILLVMLLTYLSVDPEAHERFHHDADGPDHHCVITAFAAGEALILTAVLTVRPVVTSFVQEHWPVSSAPRRAVDLGPVPICGPPAAVFSV
jgi:small-conductance mechanosensitive channel